MRKHSGPSPPLIPTFPSRRAEKSRGPARDYSPSQPEMASCIFRISQLDVCLERSAVDFVRFSLRLFARERLASKTINSLLAQNGEPELDKG